MEGALVVRALVSLGAILATLWAIAWAVRAGPPRVGALVATAGVRLRAGTRAPGGGLTRRRDLEVLDRVTLGPGGSLHLVRCGERRMMIASTPSGLTVLAGFDSVTETNAL